MWKCVALVAAVSPLMGCASEPMNDQQRQILMQYLAGQQAQQLPVVQQPYYMPTQNVAPYRAPTNCVTNQSGQTLYTNCN